MRVFEGQRVLRRRSGCCGSGFVMIKVGLQDLGGGWEIPFPGSHSPTETLGTKLRVGGKKCTNSRKYGWNNCTNSLENDLFYVVNPSTGNTAANRR